MLDSRLLRTDPGAVAANLARRGFVLDTAQLGALDDRRRLLQLEQDRLRNERNTRSKAIGRAKAQGQDIEEFPYFKRWQAEIAARSQARLVDEARSMRDSISGVNLDEEAANLLRYQQAYQAAAQVIAVSSTLFDTLLMAVRR